jgi:glutathione S-transferase
MYTLYGMTESGNCYKPRLLMAHLDIPYEWVEVDIVRGESRTPHFLAMNPNGRVPLLELTPGEFLAESNAMLYYLSQDTPYFPPERLAQARVMQWLFFEQYSHEPYIATSRYWLHILDGAEEYAEKLAERRAPGYAALGVMEQHLRNHDYLVDERFTIADIALYAYTHVAEEGGFDLASYPAIRTWLDRVAALPGHVPMRSNSGVQ